MRSSRSNARTTPQMEQVSDLDPLEVGFEKLLQAHGAKGVPAIVRLSRDLFDLMTAKSRQPEPLLESLRDREYNPYQHACLAARLNESLRRLGPNSEAFIKTVEALERGNPRAFLLNSLALEGLRHDRIVEACKGRLMAYGQNESPENVVSAVVALSLLESHRAADGTLSKSSEDVFQECLKLPIFPSHFKDMIAKIGNTYRYLGGLQDIFLEECRRAVADLPNPMVILYDYCPPAEEQPTLCRINARSLLGSYEIRALEGASMLLRSWGPLYTEDELQIRLEILKDPSMDWTNRALCACELRGSGSQEPDLVDLIRDENLETKILAAIALWNKEMSSDAQTGLLAIMKETSDEAAAIAAFTLGSTQDAEVGRRISFGGAGLPADRCSLLRDSYLQGFWSDSPERVYMEWRASGRLNLDTRRDLNFCDQDSKDPYGGAATQPKLSLSVAITHRPHETLLEDGLSGNRDAQALYEKSRPSEGLSLLWCESTALKLVDNRTAMAFIFRLYTDPCAQQTSYFEFRDGLRRLFRTDPGNSCEMRIMLAARIIEDTLSTHGLGFFSDREKQRLLLESYRDPWSLLSNEYLAQYIDSKHLKEIFR